MEKRVIRVREFMTMKDCDVDSQLTDFIDEYVYEVVDIKYNTFLDTKNDIIMSCALLIYVPRTCISNYEQIWQSPSTFEFIDKFCEVDNDLPVSERIELKDFKAKYKLWCYENDKIPVSITHKYIWDTLYPKYKTRVIKNNTNYLSNLKWNENGKDE